MRVSDRLRMRTSSRQLSKLAVEQQRATEEALTGKRVMLASDDPTSFGAASRLRQESERQGSFMKSGEKAEDYFRHADSVLDSAVDILSRARELSVQFANEAMPQEQMVAAAEEVRALKDPRTYDWSQIANFSRGWLEYLVSYENDGDTRRLTVGRKIKGEVIPVKDAKGRETTITNTDYWMGPDVVVGTATKGKVRAYGRVWDFDGRSAEICQIDWKGPR